MAIGTPVELLHPAPLTGNRTSFTSGALPAIPAGSLVIVQFGVHHTTATALAPGAYADSLGNSYMAGAGVGRTNSRMNTSSWFFFYPAGAAAGTTVTLSNFAGSGATADICWFGAWSVSGMVSSSILDVTKTGNGFSTAPTTAASSATAQADELLWFSIMDGSTGSITQTWPPTTPASAVSLVDQERSGAFGWSVGYKIISATGAQTVASSLSGNDDWVASLSTFKASLTPTYYGSGSGPFETCSQAAMDYNQGQPSSSVSFPFALFT